MLNIAIDGPVGAGKSTIADEVAARLHICTWIRAPCTAP